VIGIDTCVPLSVVVPIKDETDVLKFSLPSIYALQPDEVVIPIEPSPEGIKMVERIARKCGYQRKTRIIVLHEKTPDWRFRQAYARRKGFHEARNDLILTADADIIVDTKIKNYFNLVGKGDIRLVSFSKFPYPVSARMMIAWLIQRLRHYRMHTGFTGLYVFSKSAWLETEDAESLKKILRGEDSHLDEALIRKYGHVFVAGVKNVVLRPAESWRYQYLMGAGKWLTRKTPLWKVLRDTFLYFRPWMFIGYMKTRFGESIDAQSS